MNRKYIKNKSNNSATNYTIQKVICAGILSFDIFVTKIQKMLNLFPAFDDFTIFSLHFQANCHFFNKLAKSIQRCFRLFFDIFLRRLSKI